MPRIPQEFISSVFYLYASREDGLAGRDPRGTGFVVHYDERAANSRAVSRHLYAVTNWHVACDGGFSTVRLNAKDSGADVLEFGPEEWSFIPGQFDIAAIPLKLDDAIHNITSISTRSFLQRPPQYMSALIGVGEDVFMIGLFVDHDGISRNVPSARFGNISMLPNPDATIRQPTGYNGVSYVIDLHSRSGFSGSPVYVYRTFGTDLTDSWGSHFDSIEMDIAEIEIQPSRVGRSMDLGRGPFSGRLRSTGGRLHSNNLLKLLGIHWGQFPERWELGNESQLKEVRRDLILDGAYVKGTSGMSCVIPSWQILELLESPELRKKRALEDGASEGVPLRS